MKMTVIGKTILPSQFRLQMKESSTRSSQPLRKPQSEPSIIVYRTVCARHILCLTALSSGVTVQDVTEESVWLTVVVDVNALFCLAMAYTAIKNGNGYEFFLVGISTLVLTVRLILGELYLALSEFFTAGRAALGLMILVVFFDIVYMLFACNIQQPLDE